MLFLIAWIFNARHFSLSWLHVEPNPLYPCRLITRKVCFGTVENWAARQETVIAGGHLLQLFAFSIFCGPPTLYVFEFYIHFIFICKFFHRTNVLSVLHSSVPNHWMTWVFSENETWGLSSTRSFCLCVCISVCETILITVKLRLCPLCFFDYRHLIALMRR